MPWPQNAYVGQKVVCVNNRLPFPTHYLQQGEVYTIRLIKLSMGYIYFALEGIANNDPVDGFLASRFRPVQSTETGMSILRGLLKPTKVREDA